MDTRLSRRRLLQAAAALPVALVCAQRAGAHHGWSSFDETKPLYFAGEVVGVRWQNPHAELELKLDDALALPKDLASRSVPAQKQAVDGAKILAGAALPPSRGTWTVELAPLTRLSAWQVPEIRVGERVAVIGYTKAGAADARATRAEYLLLGEKVYPLRSPPA